MALQDKLDEYKVGFRKKVPQEKQDVMARATNDLRNSGILNDVVKPGDVIEDFALPNQDGETISLKDLRAKGPVVISFFRGGWCPYCNIELEAVNEAATSFGVEGASLVVISPQTQANSKKSHDEKAPDVDILVDDDNTIARKLGLVFSLPEDLREIYLSFGIDLVQANGNDKWELPMPTRLIIDTDGTVRHVHVEPDYTQRPDPSETLAALKTVSVPA